MKKTVILSFFLYVGLHSPAQEGLGIRNSNYAGIQGTFLNPSAIAGSKLDWDINLLSANTSFANNFLYAPKSSLAFFGIRKIIEGSIHENLFQTRYDLQAPDNLYNVSFSTQILGPSFFLKIRKKQEIGLTVAARAYTNIRDISGNAAQNAFDYFLSSALWNTTYQEQSARLNGMGWLEYGLHYATILYSDGRNELKAGVSLNYLQGLGAAYVKNTHLTYQVADTTAIVFTNSSVDYGRTDIDDFKHRDYHDLNHGHGFGGNIGFTYVHFDVGQKDNYLYRIGLSLLDVGSIKFDRNTASYHLAATSATFNNWYQAKFSGNTQLDQTLSAVFYNGDSAKSLTGNSYHMALPTALSLQADGNIEGNFFVNVTIVKGFSHGNNVGVVRPDVYSLTPRYETKWFEVSLPVSLIDYNHWQPRMGLAIRAGYFFIGGDALGSLLKLNDLQQVDFYGGVHYFVPAKSKQAPLFQNL
jgi:hypothetical protein